MLRNSSSIQATLTPFASDFTSPCKLLMLNKNGRHVTNLVILLPTA